MANKSHGSSAALAELVQVDSAQQTEQVSEQVYAELKEKFEDEEVLEFLLFNYSVEQLQNAQVVHPTKLDPVVLVDGAVGAVWL